MRESAEYLRMMPARSAIKSKSMAAVWRSSPGLQALGSDLLIVLTRPQHKVRDSIWKNRLTSLFLVHGLQQGERLDAFRFERTDGSCRST